MPKVGWLGNRSTGDILVLLIAGTVCGMVCVAGIWVGVIALLQPERDNNLVIGKISDTINTLIGLLAGFLAGRTDAIASRAALQHQLPDRDLNGSKTPV